MLTVLTQTPAFVSSNRSLATCSGGARPQGPRQFVVPVYGVAPIRIEARTGFGHNATLAVTERARNCLGKAASNKPTMLTR
jgi:hypothetical protein